MNVWLRDDLNIQKVLLWLNLKSLVLENFKLTVEDIHWYQDIQDTKKINVFRWGRAKRSPVAHRDHQMSVAVTAWGWLWGPGRGFLSGCGQPHVWKTCALSQLCSRSSALWSVPFSFQSSPWRSLPFHTEAPVYHCGLLKQCRLQGKALEGSCSCDRMQCQPLVSLHF